MYPSLFPCPPTLPHPRSGPGLSSHCPGVAGGSWPAAHMRDHGPGGAGRATAGGGAGAGCQGGCGCCLWVGGRVGCCLGRDVRPWGQLGVGDAACLQLTDNPTHPVTPRVAHIPPVVGCVCVCVDIVDVTEVNHDSGGGQLCGRCCMLCTLRSSVWSSVCCVLWLARMNLYPRY